MGRSIYSDQLKTHPPGFFLEVNNSLLEGLWAALALEKHPEVADEPHELERTFLLCKHVTWADFWAAFPYKLREGGSYLNELDALGLLLSSSVSKQRFQRYFEQYACCPSNSSSPGVVQINSSTPTMQDAAQQQQPQPRSTTAYRLGLRLDQMSDGETRRAVMPGRYREQYQPLLRPQQQQRQATGQLRAVRPPTAAAAVGRAAADPVAYVPPAARPLLPPAAAAAWRARPATAVGSSRAAAAARTAGAAGTAAAAGTRLTGRRRTWTEACEETGPPAPGAAAAAAGLVDRQHPTAVITATAAAEAEAGAEQPAGASATAAAAAGLGQNHEPEVNNSNMWRAVHDWLTSDDEALLVIVSSLVPYNFEGLLRDTAAVKEELQQLASSRPVPDKVVQAISDRMSTDLCDNKLIRLTASSGYSRRAAAAAAALACSDRVPYYISLAGLYKDEDVEAAILEGLFGENLARSGAPDNTEDTTAAAAAAADLDAAVASVAQQLRDHPSDQAFTAENAAAAAAILNAAAAARPQTVLEAVDAALTQNGQYTVEHFSTAEVERVRDMARELQAAPAEVVVAATVQAAAAVTELVAQFGSRAETEAMTTATAAANIAADAAADAGADGNEQAVPPPEDHAAQLERDLGVEFEPGVSAQQRIRILQALTSRRERRAAAAAAAAATETALAAGAAGPAADGNTTAADFLQDYNLRLRLFQAVRAHRERLATADTAAAAAAVDDHLQPRAQDRVAAALRTLNQRRQQQQHVSESDSDVEEGLDRMYGIWADAAGLNPGPLGTADREVTTDRQRNTQELQTLDQQIYDDSDDDDVPELLVGRFAEDSEEGSDDVADQGIWQVEPPGTENADLGPRALNAGRSGRHQVIRYRSTGVDPRFPVRSNAGGDAGYRCGELFSAYLTLLGSCHKEPLLLLIDEADAALVAGEGLGLSQMLLRVLCMLPEAVILLCCSHKPELWGGVECAVTQWGKDVPYALVDGTLNIGCHRIPKTLFYRSFTWTLS